MASLPLTVVAQDDNTITFSWQPVSADAGYRFTSTEFPGKHPHTWDSARNTVKFHKGPEGTLYTVEALDVLAVGSYPAATPPPPPPPPSGDIISPPQFQSLVKAGATISGVHVTGNGEITVPSVKIEDSSFDGFLSILKGADDFYMGGASALAFEIKAADRVVLEGNIFDGQGKIANNQIYDVRGDYPEGWVLRSNTFRNFYVDQQTHSEALYIGYSKGGLIENNTFTNNGNTGHIFFTWFGDVANPATSYPRDICVKGNTFNKTWDAYYDVNFRDEIPTSANICIQRDASTGWPQFYGDC